MKAVVIKSVFAGVVVGIGVDMEFKVGTDVVGPFIVGRGIILIVESYGVVVACVSVFDLEPLVPSSDAGVGAGLLLIAVICIVENLEERVSITVFVGEFRLLGLADD